MQKQNNYFRSFLSTSFLLSEDAAFQLFIAFYLSFCSFYIHLWISFGCILRAFFTNWLSVAFTLLHLWKTYEISDIV